MKDVNQKIIDAVIEKAKRICPDSLALIGIYGSVATGDTYEKSDLDLLLLIQDEAGFQLGSGFILNDSGVGYDIYCTNWERLKYDARCHHAQISKLMDAKIVYINDPEAYEELLKLREQTQCFLQSQERFERVKELIEKAKVCYANTHLHEKPGQVRMDAIYGINNLMDALMIFHGTYFKRGVKRALEEISRLPIDDFFPETINKIAESKEITEIRDLLKKLLLYTEAYTSREKIKEIPSDKLAGTYEEMFSNWRNKVQEAADQNNVFASFANMCSLQAMLGELSEEFEIGNYDVMEAYQPDCLPENVKLFDACLYKYEEVYKKAGLTVRHFDNVDAFVEDYLQ